MIWTMDRKGVGDFIPDNRLAMHVSPHFQTRCSSVWSSTWLRVCRRKAWKRNGTRKFLTLVQFAVRVTRESIGSWTVWQARRRENNFPTPRKFFNAPVLNGFICHFQDNTRWTYYSELTRRQWNHPSSHQHCMSVAIPYVFSLMEVPFIQHVQQLELLHGQ
jgi:hypothetical protein